MGVKHTLKDANRLLREGRVERAIAAYAAVLEEQPDDWQTANRLGDLYMQTGKTQEAVAQFTLVAQQLFDRGQMPKATALYKKVLKIVPDDDHARMQLGEIAAHQAKAAAERRRQAGGGQGALKLEGRIETLTRRADDKTALADGSPDAVAADTPADAAEPVASHPDPPANEASGDTPRRVEEAPQPTELDRVLQLNMMLIENEITAGRLRRARPLVGTMLADGPDGADRVLDLAKRMTAEQAEATVMCAEAIVDVGQRQDNWGVMAGAVRLLADWVPAQPEGRQWSPEQLQRLAQADAAARLETMRRERTAILQAFPDLAAKAGAQDSSRTDSSVIEPRVA